ncbi:MAG TPA: TetR/AcrR family transcriptional regulator [Pyrinomonadaceae bacterium]
MPRGRPRSFEIDEAIETAMTVFWTKGYQGTTIPDLADAIGINRPSLYAAFGSKENLFKLALDRYRNDPASYVNRAIAQPTAFEVFQSLMEGVVELVTDPKRPGGCLFVCGTHTLTVPDDEIGLELARRRVAGEQDILERFARAQREGDLPERNDPAALAKLAATLMWGIAVQASNGAPRDQLQQVVRLAIEGVRSQFERSK